MNPFGVRLHVHGDLTFFLKSDQRDGTLDRRLNEKSSVKDVIESCGIPHPEVDLILVDGIPAKFVETIDCDVRIDVYPVEHGSTLFTEKRLQVRKITRFISDGHLGKLVRDLRLLGFDVMYDRDAEDRQLLEQLKTEPDRALLTRDRRLLMHAVVRHGYYPRSQDPLKQTVEVMKRFELSRAFSPFTRCLRCNGPLEQVEKGAVINRLEPLTKIYYERFRRCSACGQIYWPGSHFSKLQKRIDAIEARSSEDNLHLS